MKEEKNNSVIAIKVTKYKKTILKKIATADNRSINSFMRCIIDNLISEYNYSQKQKNGG